MAKTNVHVKHPFWSLFSLLFNCQDTISSCFRYILRSTYLVIPLSYSFIMSSCTDKAPAELRSFLSSVIPFQFHEYSNNGLWMLIVFIIAYSLVLMKGEPLFFLFFNNY